MDLSYTQDEERFAHELREWLEANVEFPPENLSLSEEIAWHRRWQARLAEARWVAIGWPESYGGRGASPVQVAIYNTEYARAGAPQLVNRIGINLAGPTLLAYGTKEQASRWLSKILTAEELWCQLFSEPGAGSDLASLSTKARKVDGGWELTGQKVWTSYAQFADWGICLARSDPDAPKHKGLSFFVVDMRQAGIEVRPLIQITGEAEFNEVFLDRVFVQDDCLIGDPGEGWKVATTTLAHERGTSFAFKEEVVHESYLNRLFEYAISSGEIESPGISSALADVFVALLVLRCHNWRTLSRLSRSVSPGAESSIVKLAWTEVTQRLSDLALELCSDDDIAGAVDVSRPSAPRPVDWERQWLWSRSASIAGGTSEIQRTIIGERLLGLER
ncbi:MAG: acyl-CoA dehydrogenase family protein [Actinomycetota bacterium]|nr:acyl-CoA dehydrogenase family protein [Actinomycetota bacterium]